MAGYDFLNDVTVLEIAHLAPSSLGGYLADMGANVIKVEFGSGEQVRRSGSTAVGKSDGYGFLHLRWNRGKRSVLLNLKTPDGRRLFRELATRADIVIEGMRAGTLARLGLGYDELKARNPRLIFVSVSGFGSYGPYAGLGSHGPYYDAFGGLGAYNPYGVSNEDHSETPQPAVGMHASGLYAALGVLAAMSKARATGAGASIEVAAADAAAHWIPTALDPILNETLLVERPGFAGRTGKMKLWPRLNAYEAIDGKSIYFQSTEEKFWQRFCDVVGRPDLLKVYELMDDQAEADEQMYAELTRLFATRSAAEWTALFVENDIAGGPVNTPRDLTQDKHFLARDSVYAVDYPGVGTVRLTSTPVKVEGQRFEPTLAPDLGEHTDEVLSQMLDLSPDDLDQLRLAGVLA